MLDAAASDNHPIPETKEPKFDTLSLRVPAPARAHGLHWTEDAVLEHCVL